MPEPGKKIRKRIQDIMNQIEGENPIVWDFLERATIEDLLTIANIVTEKEDCRMSSGDYYDIHEALEILELRPDYY